MVVQKEIDLKALQSVVEDAMQTAIDNCEEAKRMARMAYKIAMLEEKEITNKGEKYEKN